MDPIRQAADRGGEGDVVDELRLSGGFAEAADAAALYNATGGDPLPESMDDLDAVPLIAAHSAVTGWTLECDIGRARDELGFDHALELVLALYRLQHRRARLAELIGEPTTAE